MPKSQNIGNNNTNGENIELIAYKIDDIQADMKDVKAKLESNYATKEWCQAQFGQTTKMFNIFLIAVGTGLVAAFVAFIVNGGLKIK